MFSFLSIEFALSFIAFFGLYWACYRQPQWQNILLTITSYTIIYLMASMTAVAILFTYTCIIYFINKKMQQQPNKKKKFLLAGVVFSIAQLSLFKYYDFFREHVSQFLTALQFDSSGLMANLLFPLGLSYYSFQGISYLYHRYKHDHDVADFNFMQLMTHFSFFPTITAGPIARAKPVASLTDIHHQPCGMSQQLCQTTPRQLLYPILALSLLLLALFKKWWLAGWLAEHWVNPIFENPMQYHSLEILVAIYAYTLQLFLDFSGYSEMMIAFGLLLGFRLPMNFRAPLLAHNIRVFWERWHISLSTWIRDYIYIPLGGNRAGFTRTQLNLFIAMGLSGIWHGSSLNFLLWGLLHGGAIVLLNCSEYFIHRRYQIPIAESRNLLAKKGRWGKILGVFMTVQFVCFCFVFFRASSWQEATQVFSALWQNMTQVAWTNNPYYMLILFSIAWLCYPAVLKHGTRVRPYFLHLPIYMQATLLFIAFVIIMIFAPSGIPGFIYANF